jgi:membrane protease YdiL (CAAX protease family)
MRDDATLPRFTRWFICRDEFRPRAFWRLLLHGLLTMLFVLIFGLILGIALLFIEGTQILEKQETLLRYEVLIALPAITFSTFIARRIFDRRSFVSLGFHFDRHTLRDLLVGFLIPGLLMGLIFLLELALGWLTIDRFTWDSVPLRQWMPETLLGLLIFMGVGFYEELLARGYHFHNLEEGLNLPWALLLSSVIFALLHWANPYVSPFSILGLLAAGLYLGFAYLRTRQLWLPIGLHIGWNFFEGYVFGFPVSGTSTLRLVQQTVSGPELITGGAFGPEAGLIVLPVLALGAGLIFWYTHRRSAPKASTSLADELFKSTF